MERACKVSIVMPAYNEEANIEKMVRASCAALEASGVEGEVIVTNDGSRDGTLGLLKTLEKQFPNLLVVDHRTNMGYGAALKSAIRSSSGEYVITIDSDGQFDIGELPLFLGSANGKGVVTGYRKKKSDTFFRVAANRGLNGMISVFFGARLKDINCAFRMFKGDVLRSVNIESRGYQAPSEIMIKLMNMGVGVEEVGVSHYARSGGLSKLRPFKTMAQMSMFLVYLKLKILLYRKGLLNSL